MRREHQSGSRHTSPSSIKSLDQVKVGDKLIVRGVFRDKEERCEAIVIEIKRPSQQQKLSNGDDPGNGMN
jgi:hypothetical protein